MEEKVYMFSPGQSLPFDLIAEILYRLPVKILLRLQSVCKSWNSLISHPKFTIKHLTYSTTVALHFLSYSSPSRKFILTSYPLQTLFTNLTTNFTQVEYPQRNILTSLDYFVGSCHGIVCLSNYSGTLLLFWNPSIRKYKELHIIRWSESSRRTDVEYGFINVEYGFGYDGVNHVYKVVVVLNYIWGKDVQKTVVKIHSLGTNIWKTMHKFSSGGVFVRHSGQFVGGAINWLAYNDCHRKSPSFIISFDLEKESYRKILQPDYEEINVSMNTCQMGVWKDCMWVIYGHDVWVMKEYGNKESWTKLFTISCDFTKVINILEDDLVLLEYRKMMIVYYFKNRTFRFTEYEIQRFPQVSVESLISPFINFFASHKLKK